MTPRSAAQPEEVGEKRAFTAAERAHAALIVDLLSPMVEPLSRALEPRTEVVLHDLTRMPGTIVAIANSLTGRQLGGPATDLGLRVFSSGWNEDLVGYRTEMGDGTPMRSSSIFFRAPDSGRAVVSLCMNTDVSEVVRAQELLRQLSAVTSIDASLHQHETATPERFPASVDELAVGLLDEAVGAAGVAVADMKKPQKVEVVRYLAERGFFTMRESVPLVAKYLGVGRHTIYNYLNEVEHADAAPTSR